MTVEQWVVRLVFVLPSLAIILLCPPYQGGGFQFMGLADIPFLTSGALNLGRWFVEVTAVLIVWGLLELYARQADEVFLVRLPSSYLSQRR